ncbi:MAG: GH3 auxin-responsive promoter family protein [Bacteroidota bacterium]
MLKMVHNIASWYLKRRLDQINHFRKHPFKVQQRLFEDLLEKGKDTKWGKHFGYGSIQTLRQFQEQVPLSSYEEIHPWIQRAFDGEEDVLWPGRTVWFSKSSGTTNDKSKFIPVTPEAMEDCHFRAGQDFLAVYLENKPESKLFTGKSLSIGGSHNPHALQPSVRFGDVSAVLTENLPAFYELMRAPRKEVALLSNWEEKLEAITKEVMNEDITSIAGVPTWTLVLIRHILEKQGITSGNLLEVWPNLELYLHGGVSFAPYRDQFATLIPKASMTYMDCYNASEGFFGFQDEPDRQDLLLLLDHGIFYEFIKVEDLGQDHPRAVGIHEVALGQNYALALSTNAGLWRYLIGDTIRFTSLSPFKFQITGRTKQFINAFGEELMVDNAETALSEASRETGAIIENYTAAPIYLEGKSKGGHEWLIEFRHEPDDFARFVSLLDEQLKQLNSDYEAKRQANLALEAPVVRAMPIGTFERWMKKRGKLGGQHKVPRLANERKYVDDILADVGSAT